MEKISLLRYVINVSENIGKREEEKPPNDDQNYHKPPFNDTNILCIIFIFSSVHFICNNRFILPCMYITRTVALLERLTIYIG